MKKINPKVIPMRVTHWDSNRKVHHLYHLRFLKDFADGLIERTSFMLDEIDSKIVHKDVEGEQ